ncbi:hypothetical protein [Streptomyces lavendofoliae]|uniref:SHOCT domain-containing protein n=1 Tax=Streptomyces lavendofoliae TaxID=67314 RepID=A0A918M4D7_9ACTN|nr:hypothetical protein [Streptomyces lavendofoliae]GGU42375.1 hypothetical protein GCM10010274_32940 [Streptomyces lavendofoliae]
MGAGIPSAPADGSDPYRLVVAGAGRRGRGGPAAAPERPGGGRPPTAEPPPAADDDVLLRLRDLADPLRTGILTDEESTAAKQAVLKQL